MARVTVEDCVEQIPNRFELVVLAAQRARHISAGAQITLERDNDKNPVVALREIAEQTVDLKELEDALVQTMQRHVETDEPEDDVVDGDAIRQELSGDMSMGDNDIAALAKTMSIDDGAADADEDGDMMFEDVEDAED